MAVPRIGFGEMLLYSHRNCGCHRESYGEIATSVTILRFQLPLKFMFRIN